MDEQNEVEKRKAEFLAELEKRGRDAHGNARRLEAIVDVMFYLTLLFGGLAVLAGLLRDDNIKPYMVSILAALGTGASVLAREGRYRAKANWFYAVRDLADELHLKVRLRLPIPLTQESLARVVEEWSERRKLLGDKMAIIHNERDGPKASESSSRSPSSGRS